MIKRGCNTYVCFSLGKNPREIIEEMEKIDDMEFNPVTPCPLNQKVRYFI
jgi:hypothetical protein